jgi:phosphoribosylamine-glycine ligase
MSSAEDAAAAADKIGYPVLLKATGGGGGRGIFICNNTDEVLSQFSVSQKQGEQFFGNAGVSGHALQGGGVCMHTSFPVISFACHAMSGTCSHCN